MWRRQRRVIKKVYKVADPLMVLILLLRRKFTLFFTLFLNAVFFCFYSYSST